MELLSIKENEVRVELHWDDVLLLAHLCRHALSRDALHDAPNWPAVAGHAETMIAFLEAAGLASYASFTGCDETYTIEGFRELYPLHGQHAAWQARQRQREVAPAEGKDGEAA